MATDDPRDVPSPPVFTRIDATVPTFEMREALEIEGVALPTEDELKALSHTFNKMLEAARVSASTSSRSFSEQQGRGVSWFKLFNEVDMDRSGTVTFDELQRVARSKVGIKASHISEMQLRALWCALDVDDSNTIKVDEMVRFLKLSPVVHETWDDVPASVVNDGPNLKRVDVIVPTSEMRAEIEASGIELPEGEKLHSLSKLYNEGLEAVRVLENKPGLSWFSLFQEIDEDQSGEVTWDEFKRVARVRLSLKLPDLELKALWCALDVDDSDNILPNEMSRFLRLAPTATNKGLEAINKQREREAKAAALAAADEPDMKRVDAIIPTAEMREVLKHHGVALPTEEQLCAYSKEFNERLEAIRLLEQKAGMSWFNLFTEIDEDQSGEVTWDEFKRVVRTRLRLRLPDLELKALWCALDVDDSDNILPNEMSRFLRLGASRKATAHQRRGRMVSDEPDMARIDAAVPTRKMRSILQSAHVPLPGADELLALSGTFNERLAKASVKASTRTRSFSHDKKNDVSWMKLFNEVDEDHSGGITFDEFYRVVRGKVGLMENQITEEQLMAVWCVLDADDSNIVRIDEMFMFLKGNVEGLKKASQRKRSAKAQMRKPWDDPDAPKATIERIEASMAAKQKSLAQRTERIQKLREELRKLDEQLSSKSRTVRSPRLLRPGGSSSPPGKRRLSPPKKRSPLQLQRSFGPAEIREQLKAALLDIAFDPGHGGSHRPSSRSALSRTTSHSSPLLPPLSPGSPHGAPPSPLARLSTPEAVRWQVPSAADVPWEVMFSSPLPGAFLSAETSDALDLRRPGTAFSPGSAGAWDFWS
jgi:Ca2+-binding EF-hand superfamily protein